MCHKPGDTLYWKPELSELGERKVSQKQNEHRFLPGEAAAVSGMAGQCQIQAKLKEIRFIHSLVCLFIQNGENREEAQL